MDTAGFLQIALGKNIDEIEKGLSLVRKARRIGLKSNDLEIKQISEIFTLRHERIAFLRLADKAHSAAKVCYPNFV